MQRTAIRSSQTISSHNYLHSTTIAFLKLLQRRKTCHAPPSGGSRRQRGRPAVPVRSADWKNGLHRPGVRMTLQFNHPATAAGESDRGDAAAHVRCFGGLGRETEKRAVRAPPYSKRRHGSRFVHGSRMRTGRRRGGSTTELPAKRLPFRHNGRAFHTQSAIRAAWGTLSCYVSRTGRAGEWNPSKARWNREGIFIGIATHAGRLCAGFL